MNIKYLADKGEQKENITSSETYRSDILSDLPSILEAIILDWGRGLSRKLNRPVNVWKELSILTGRAPSTLRAYCDEFNPTFPPIDVLLSICKATGKDDPLKLIEQFRKIHFEA